MIRIFSDSTCDLSQELIERYNITIIPLHIVLGEKEYLDGKNITPDQIYAWADANKTTPKTSACAYEDAVAAFRPVIGAGDEIIVFSISDSMSTTGNIFRMAAEDMHAEDRISVIDSQNLSTGIGLLVLAAAEARDAGKSRKEIVSELEELIPRVRASFVVDTLVYLYRGGRCNAVAALAGSMLKLHPKIVVENGAMDASKKYRGKLPVVIRTYAKDMEQELLKAEKGHVFITHSGCDDKTVAMVKEYLLSLNCFDEIHITRAGGVVSSHCGPGTLGVLFIEGKQEK